MVSWYQQIDVIFIRIHVFMHPAQKYPNVSVLQRNDGNTTDGYAYFGELSDWMIVVTCMRKKVVQKNRRIVCMIFVNFEILAEWIRHDRRVISVQAVHQNFVFPLCNIMLTLFPNIPHDCPTCLWIMIVALIFLSCICSWWLRLHSIFQMYYNCIWIQRSTHGTVLFVIVVFLNLAEVSLRICVAQMCSRKVCATGTTYLFEFLKCVMNAMNIRIQLYCCAFSSWYALHVTVLIKYRWRLVVMGLIPCFHEFSAVLVFLLSWFCAYDSHINETTRCQ